MFRKKTLKFHFIRFDIFVLEKYYIKNASLHKIQTIADDKQWLKP